jgi:hypothetical protein
MKVHMATPQDASAIADIHESPSISMIVLPTKCTISPDILLAASKTSSGPIATFTPDQ